MIDIVLAVYLLLAVTAFNSPKELVKKCTKVNINITDESTYGFLDAEEIKAILTKKGIYPLEKDLDKISPRKIESVLRNSPFVNTAECCKTTDGHVLIYVTQRSPLVRIKSRNGDDYYIDENGGIMPNSKYTSDLIIVTGNVSKQFARQYISVLANAIMKSDFWRNQVEQINVRQDFGIEVVPRVGDHIIFLGYLPEAATQQKRIDEVTAYTNEKLDRLEKFYIYGLKETGWTSMRPLMCSSATRLSARNIRKKRKYRSPHHRNRSPKAFMTWRQESWMDKRRSKNKTRNRIINNRKYS